MWLSDLLWYKERAESISWTRKEIVDCINEMEETPDEDQPPLEEFQWADISVAILKTSELVWIIADMPYFFWAFTVLLCAQFSYVAYLLMDVWIEFLHVQLGRLMVDVALCLFCVASWPPFLTFLWRVVCKANSVIEQEQRTIQLRDVPEEYCTDVALTNFIAEHGIKHVESQTVNLMKNTWHLKFSSRYDLKNAFKNHDGTKKLGKDAVLARRFLSKVRVHVGLKLGRSTSNIRWWLVCFHYLKNELPAQVWFRVTLLCFITMSLASRFAIFYADRILEKADHLKLRLKLPLAVLSLLLFFIYGCHGLMDVKDALEIEELP